MSDATTIPTIETLDQLRAAYPLGSTIVRWNEEFTVVGHRLTRTYKSPQLFVQPSNGIRRMWIGIDRQQPPSEQP